MNNFIPAEYNAMNMYESSYIPSSVKNLDNATAAYYKRYLLQKAMSVIKWNLPEWWPSNYFLYTLYCWGTVAVFNTSKHGTIFARPTLKGFNVFYQPTNCVITLPGENETLDLKIGKDCELIKLTPDYCGIMDMINRYAIKLALCEQAIIANLRSSVFSYVFFAKNDAAAKAFRKMYDNITQGEPNVVVDKNLLDSQNGDKLTWQFFAQDLKNNYLVSTIMEDMRKIENSFATDVGIPNANTEKKERMLVDEVNANNTETITRTAMWMCDWKKSCEAINKKYGLDLSVDWRVSLTRQEENNGRSYSDDRRDVGMESADSNKR